MNETQYNRKIQIVLFFIISTLFFISISAYTAFATPFAQETGLSSSQIGTVLGATGLASLLTRFPVGLLSQLMKKKKTMMRIGLLLVFSWLIVYFSPGFATMYLAKLLGGITSATWVMYTVMFTSYFTEEELPQSIGVIQLASSIGPLIAGNIGGFFVARSGNVYAFLVAVAAAAVALVLTFFLKEPNSTPAAPAKEVLHTAKNQLTSKNAWIIGLFAAVAMMTTYAGVDFLIPVKIGLMGGTALERTMLTNCFRICGMIAAPVCGIVFYRVLGLVKTIALSSIATGIVTMSCFFASNFGLLYVLWGLEGFFFNVFITALMALVIMGVRAEEKPARMGLYQSIYSLGLMVGPMISGHLVDVLSLQTCFIIMGVSIIVAGILAKPLLPKDLIAASKREMQASTPAK